MDKYDMMYKLAEAQNIIMDAVTKLGTVERQLLNDKATVIELSSLDLGQLEDGFTITVIHEGRALRLRMRQLVDNSKN